MGISLGDAPSWILALVVGLGILWGVTNGMLDTTYSIEGLSLPMESLGGLLVIGAILLGGFYFLQDITNKI
jgi:hypothetical protein